MPGPRPFWWTRTTRQVDYAADPDVLIVGPDVDLPDGPALEVDPPDPRAGPDRLHVGDDRGPQGGGAGPRNLLVERERCGSRGAGALRSPGPRLPLFHMHGLGVGLHGTLLAGASAISPAGFEPERRPRRRGRRDATLFFGVPDHVRRWSTPRGGPAGRAAAVRLRLGAAERRAAHSVEPGSGQGVLERYGMTETVMLSRTPTR